MTKRQLDSEDSEGISGEIVSESDEGEATSSDSEELDPAKKDIPFGQLLSQQGNGLTGPRQAPGRMSLTKPKERSSMATAKLKRENKNRPVETSSKKPVSRSRKALEVPSRKSRDPRFDETTGKFKDDVFKKRYAFIFDENLPQERQDTVKRLKITKGGSSERYLLQRTKSAARQKELQGSLTRIQQQIRGVKDERRRQEVEAEAKAREREAVKQGKKPFFLKRSEKKRQELVRRYEDLKATGRLQKVMAKKRKKNAAKDHRYLPSSQRD